MGGKESKQICINYEDALKRVSESEHRRIKDAFKKSAGVGRLYLSRNAFQQDVLCEGVPPNVVDLLYSACGGSAKGISFKDLLCGLVLLTKGTEDEKIRFLWNLYCNDSGTFIIKSEYIKAVNLPSSESVSLFAHNDKVNFEQFRDWIVNHRNSTVLSKWLLSDACIQLTSELETPTFYQSLAGVTHLEEKDIGYLEKEFWLLKNSSPNGQLDLQYLGPLISPPIPKNALKGLFNAFDENRDGHIDFKELCCGVSAACRGPGVERTRFCFKIFDVDRDGKLSHEESFQMINVLLFVAKENRNSNIYKDLSRHDAIADLLTFAARKADADTAANVTVNATAANDSITADNVCLTAEDFMMWSVESSLKLVQPFLDLTFEVCHIVFGLRPQCRHMEYDIVRGWLKREEKRPYRVGQFWYLISHDWWLSWMQYSQTITSPCVYCKRASTSQRSSNVGSTTIGAGIDEASVCDESFNTNSIDSSIGGDTATTADNCSLGSTSSGISSGRYGCRPGPIDNTNLITPNPYKNVRPLTGEGGHLKRDQPLVQNHDFVLVPKSLWKALSRWYSDIIPLPRQVIQPPNSQDVELELYPLNLRILLHQNMPNTQSVNSWGAVSGSYGVMASGGGYAAITASSVLQPPKRYLAYTAAFSRLATVRQIGEFLCDQLRHRIEDVRLWHIPANSMDSSAILLEEDHMTLKELLIKDNDQLLLEIRNKDQTWPEELGSLSIGQSGGSGGVSVGVGGNAVMSYAGGDRRLTRTSIMSVHAPGATGLHNLGNTCFMNAALQVLFNTQPLAQYFHRGMHQFELNTANKLGTRGILALRYGELLKEVWTATTRSVAPLKLRFCVTKHAPQFAGGGQHDSQELLEWLLDALHEDLNRVMEKPYSELRDSNGRPDKIVAAEAWSQHHARNQSIVIDLFYGQLKSKVSCLCCGRESVRFDPFSLLSLPLPVENYVYFEALVILLDGSVPIKYGLRLNSEAKYADLKLKLASLCHLNPNFMLICEIWNSQIRNILPDEQKIKPATAKELYIYQMPEVSGDYSRSSSTLGMNIEKGLKDIQRSSALFNGHDSLSSLNTLNALNRIELAMQTMPSTFIEESLSNGLLDLNKRSTMVNSLNPPPAAMATTTTTTTSSSAASSNRPIASIANEDDTDDDVHVATKHNPTLSQSPENTFALGHHHSSTHKRVSADKLLSVDCNTPTSSLTNLTDGGGGNHSIDSNAGLVALTTTNPTTTTEPMPMAMMTCDGGRQMNDCPCRQNPNGRIVDDEITSEEMRTAETSFGSPFSGGVGGGVDVDDTDNGRMNNNISLNDQSMQSESLGIGVGIGGHHQRFDSSDSNGNNGSVTGGLFSRIPLPLQSRVGKYLVAVHRKITRQDSYFLSHHKTRPSLFGVPLLIPNSEGGSHKDLYCAVWLQVSRLLSPLPASTDQANHAADCDDSLGYDFPFTLRAVRSDGLTCALCPWSNFCRGCEIPCDNDYLITTSATATANAGSNGSVTGSVNGGYTIPDSSNTSNASTPKMSSKLFASSMPNLETKRASQQQQQQQQPQPAADAISSHSNNFPTRNFDDFTIAIDWDPTALHLRYQSTLERLWTEHDSVAICRREQVEPVDLKHCLEAFTSEEKLEQWYYCSHCKGKKPATKKLQIWKLPPILIVHLKRFNCVNGKWVKSQKVVHFPFKDFDPTPYLASVPQETILRHKELLEQRDCHIHELDGSHRNNNDNNLKDNDDDDDDDDHNHDDNNDKAIGDEWRMPQAMQQQQKQRQQHQQPSRKMTLPGIGENDAQLVNGDCSSSSNSSNNNNNNDDDDDDDDNNDDVNNDIVKLENHRLGEVGGGDGGDNGDSERRIRSGGSGCDDADNEPEEMFDNVDMENGDYLNAIGGDGFVAARERRRSGPPKTQHVNTTERKKRARLVSSSLVRTPIIDGAFEDYHQHKLKPGEDKFDPKYNLYAVVSHSGMLNGGHYISYAANQSGNWYCYNDSSCREITGQQPNIDPSSAYLLFYERRGLDYEPYLPNIEGKTLPQNGNNASGIDLDEGDSDLRKMCSIS